jgi:hypothetical protein
LADPDRDGQQGYAEAREPLNLGLIACRKRDTAAQPGWKTRCSPKCDRPHPIRARTRGKNILRYSSISVRGADSLWAAGTFPAAYSEHLYVKDGWRYPDVKDSLG